MNKLKYHASRMNLKLLFPALAGACVLAISLVVWQVFSANETRHAGRIVKDRAAAVSHYIRDGVESRISALERMARRVEDRTPTSGEWEYDVRLNTAGYPGFNHIERLDLANGERIVPRGAGARSAVGELLASDDNLRETIASSARSHKVVLILTSRSGEFGKWLLVGVPIFKGGEPNGFIIGLIETEELFNSILHADLIRGYSVAVFHGNKEIYRSSQEDRNTGEPKVQQAELMNSSGLSLQVVVWPEPEYLSDISSSLSTLPLFIGPLLAMALFASIYFAQRAAEREKEAVRVNIELKEENCKRMMAEEKAARHAKALERSNAELEQFAYVASHDLQEPLRIISGYMQLLEKRYRGKLGEDADEFIRHSVAAVSRMQILIGDILAYSRVGSGGRKIERLDLKGVLAVVLADLKASIDESGALVTHDDLPVIEADSSQMYHLLMNLVGNAIKYRGHAAPRIHIGAAQRPGEWLFWVKDNGIGMDMKDSVRIFDVFERLHGNDRYSGTGIGLAICKKAVESHGGRIWVESSPGDGSVFYFTIPDRKP